MKIAIVGGTGLVGAHAAQHLQGLGHDITLFARSKPAATGLQSMPFVPTDYIADDIADGRLDGFDGLVFAAAQDVRHLPRDGSETPEAFFDRVNDQPVPAFFKAAEKAGITRTVYIGSFYPQVAPQQIEKDPYVRSRHITDEAVRALSSDSFNVCSLNAPFILGHVPGLDIPHLAGLVAYVSGQLPDLPLFAPKGGTNHITAQSVAEAIASALDRGESGKAYLIGDENLSWKQYLEAWAAAAGAPVELEVLEDDHPILPNAIMFAGAGATVSYEPDAAESALLDYSRNQITAEIQAVVDSVLKSSG